MSDSPLKISCKIEKKHFTNSKHNTAGMFVLISDKMGVFHNNKRVKIIQEDIVILTVCTTTYRTLEHI